MIFFPEFILGATALPEGGRRRDNRTRDRRRLPKGCCLPRARSGQDQVGLIAALTEGPNVVWQMGGMPEGRLLNDYLNF